MDSLQLLQNGGIVLALSGILTQVFKGIIPNRFIPLFPLVIGIVFGLLTMGLSVESGLIGLFAGLAAGGLYDQKKVFKKSEPELEFDGK